MAVIRFENTEALFAYICRYWLAPALSIDVTGLSDSEVYRELLRSLTMTDEICPELSPKVLNLLPSLRSVATMCERLEQIHEH